MFIDGAEEPIPTRGRTIIIGGGLAGLELANELDRLGARDVLVVEAGAATDLRHVNAAFTPEQALRMWLDPTADSSFAQPWRSTTPPHYSGSSGLRRRLGGRSLYWYGVCLPIESSVLADPRWPRAVVRDLTETWKGGESLYARLTRHLDGWGGAASREPRPAAAVRLGEHRLSPAPRAIRWCRDDARGWYAYSPLDRWRDPETGAVHRHPQGFRICLGTEVTEVRLGDGACAGVVARRIGGEELHVIECDTVVLACGTVESSRLAIQALAAAGASTSPRLSGLVDHIVQGMAATLDVRASRKLLDAVPSGTYVSSRASEIRSNLFLDVQRLDDGRTVVELQAMGEQMRSPESWVSCTAQRRFPWHVEVTARLTDPDRRLLVDQRELVRSAWSAVARIVGLPDSGLEFEAYGLAERGNACVLPESLAAVSPGVPVTWSNVLGTEDHEAGTLPLGDLLDDRHEFEAIPGLFAAGPATFPRLGAANPSLTTLSLAHRLAAQLADRASIEQSATGGPSRELERQ